MSAVEARRHLSFGVRAMIMVSPSALGLAAVAFHLRAKDLRNLPTPLAYEVLAIAALVLRIATL